MTYKAHLLTKLSMERGKIAYAKIVRDTGLSRKEVEKQMGGRFELEMWHNRNSIKEVNRK